MPFVSCADVLINEEQSFLRMPRMAAQNGIAFPAGLISSINSLPELFCVVDDFYRVIAFEM